MGLQIGFDLYARDVLACNLYQIYVPIDEIKILILVKISDIARMQPAVLVDGFVCCLGVFEISVKDSLASFASYANFALFVSAKLFAVFIHDLCLVAKAHSADRWKFSLFARSIADEPHDRFAHSVRA